MNKSTSLDNEFQYLVIDRRVYDITIIDCLGGIYLVLLTSLNHIDLELRSQSNFVLSLYDFKRSAKLNIHLPDSL